MAVPIFNNTKVGSSESSRVLTARTEEDFITPGIASVQERLGALAKIKEQQAENEGTGEYLKWNEEASAKSQELQLKNGSNAVGLEDEFNQWNDEYKNNLNFSSREAEQDFDDRVTTSLSNYKKNIKTYEVKENFEYSNQLKEAEYSQANQNYVVALFNNDEKAQDDTKIKAMVAFEQLHSGQPEEFIDIEFQKSWDLTTTSVLDQMVRNGEVVQAFTTMEKANTNKQVSDASKSLFYNTHKVALAKSYGKTRAESKVGEFTYYNNEEWAIYNGQDTSNMTEAQKEMNSGFRRSGKEITTMAQNSLLSSEYNDNTFFPGNENFNKMVNSETNSAMAGIKKQADIIHKTAVDDLNTKITNLVYQKEYNDKDLNEVAKINAEIEVNVGELAESYGEYKLVSKIKELETKKSSSVYGEFSKVYFGILAGTQDSRSIIESDRLDWKEKNVLTSTYNKMKVENIENRYSTLVSEMMSKMTGKDDIDDLDPDSKTAFEGAVSALVSELTNKEIDKMTNDDIDRLLRESVSVGWTLLDAQQLKSAKRLAKPVGLRVIDDLVESLANNPVVKSDLGRNISILGRNLLKRF